jgi:hypothetical protein
VLQTNGKFQRPGLRHGFQALVQTAPGKSMMRRRHLRDRLEILKKLDSTRRTLKPSFSPITGMGPKGHH